MKRESRRKAKKIGIVQPESCERCEIEYPFLQLEHIVPRHAGGTDDPENWQWLCPNCHVLKTRTEDPRPVVSLETREKLRLSMVGNQHRAGKPQTDDERRKKSEALKGRPKSAEMRQKLSVTRTGMTLSEETRRKIGEASSKRVGWTHSKETKQKMSESQKRRYQEVA